MKWIVSATMVSVLLVGASGSVWDDLGARKTIMVNTGYLTGNRFRELTRIEKMYYVMGRHDAMCAASMFGAPDSFVIEVVSCMKDMDSLQLAAIVEKYLDDHPEKWHLGMNTLIFPAFRDVCEDKPKTDSEN